MTEQILKEVINTPKAVHDLEGDDQEIIGLAAQVQVLASEIEQAARMRSGACSFVVRRDGGRDIEFTGLELGPGAMRNGTGRGTDVATFRTTSGRYVVAVRTWTAWESERDSHRAGVCDTPADVLEWLIDDAGGSLGRASKEALEDAADHDAGIAAILTEGI